MRRHGRPLNVLTAVIVDRGRDEVKTRRRKATLQAVHARICGVPDRYPFADVELARRLERAEAEANRSFVEAHARVDKGSGAAWLAVGGTYAMFDGVESPLTQTFGLGLFEPSTDERLTRLEAFFGERRARTFHEVSPLADTETAARLHARRYEPFEFTSVMYRPVAAVPVRSEPTFRIRIAGPAEQETWARTAARGWSEFPELEQFMLRFCGVIAASDAGLTFVAEADGRAVATAALTMHGGVALMAGASTVPEARKQGAQKALLDARLREAAARGCDLAMLCALPGSGSQRNGERHGFRVAYTRTKWRAPASPITAAS